MLHAWERTVSRVLLGKHEGKRLLGRPRHRWEDGIRMGPAVGSCKYGDEPAGSGATELVS
jgi:hypothetical protein